MPKSMLGLAGFLFCMGIAAAFTGAVLYAYYESRQAATTNKIDSFVGGFTEQLDAAKKIIQEEGDQTKNEIREQLGELQRLAATGTTLTALLERVQPSVWFVSSVNSDGAPLVGSAFVIFADSAQSFLLTSFSAVEAATRSPAPGVILRKGLEEFPATLYGFSAEKDMALLSIDRPNLTPLKFADASPRLGDRLYALSGLGSTGASITQGFVADVSADGIQHDAATGLQFQGGPLLDTEGNVVAVASRSYAPAGFQAETVWFAPLVRSACGVVVDCPNGLPTQPIPTG
ncbi:MAG: trypsin-like peptidase domain-containing protein [Acidimicrobiia bacterium]